MTVLFSYMYKWNTEHVLYSSYILCLCYYYAWSSAHVHVIRMYLVAWWVSIDWSLAYSHRQIDLLLTWNCLNCNTDISEVQQHLDCRNVKQCLQYSEIYPLATPPFNLHSWNKFMGTCLQYTNYCIINLIHTMANICVCV